MLLKLETVVVLSVREATNIVLKSIPKDPDQVEKWDPFLNCQDTSLFYILLLPMTRQTKRYFAKPQFVTYPTRELQLFKYESFSVNV